MDWKDTDSLVDALIKCYPNDSPNPMTESELIEKATALPGFSGEKQPPDKSCINSIIFNWGLANAVRHSKEKTDENYDWDDGFRDPAWRP